MSVPSNVLCVIYGFTCSGVSDDCYKMLLEQVKQNGGTVWACVSCRSFKAKIEKRVHAMEKWSEEVEASVAKNESDIAKLTKVFNDFQAHSKASSSAKSETIQVIKNETSDAVLLIDATMPSTV